DTFHGVKDLYDKGKVRKEKLIEARDRFCNFHKSIHIIEDGLRKNYKLMIDFEEIGDRLLECKDRLDQIVQGRMYSQFKNEILKSYKELGNLRASSIE